MRAIAHLLRRRSDCNRVDGRCHNPERAEGRRTVREQIRAQELRRLRRSSVAMADAHPPSPGVVSEQRLGLCRQTAWLVLVTSDPGASILRPARHASRVALGASLDATDPAVKQGEQICDLRLDTAIAAHRHVRLRRQLIK